MNHGAGELVRVVARDGVRLDGFWQDPGPTDRAVIFVHGLSGNFYVDFTDAFARRFLEGGWAFLRTNNRGHDMGNLTLVRHGEDSWQMRKLGSPWDHFSDAVTDIAAWVDYAAARGCRRIVLLGHSLGTVKVTYYLAETVDSRVEALVLASPADLIGMHDARHTPERLAGFLETARQMVSAGDGRMPMPAACAIGIMGHLVSAEEYLEKFGPTPAWDVFDLFDRASPRAWWHLKEITVPILSFYGTVAEAVPTPRIPAALATIAKHAPRSPRCDSRILVDADHWYVGHEDQAAATVADWLKDVFGR